MFPKDKKTRYFFKKSIQVLFLYHFFELQQTDIDKNSHERLFSSSRGLFCIQEIKLQRYFIMMRS